eukprot:TRINITY_DN10110_c0_g1_i1.p1 TRINITY_DN10110_c0_g1~~TRINITY_DN10110_c0_g1_i1.p1  ORF type:complete len:1197 (-),score=332.09 TRINITY_DN10110_c0_g1_i1:65-3619(-)
MDVETVERGGGRGGSAIPNGVDPMGLGRGRGSNAPPLRTSSTPGKRAVNAKKSATKKSGTPQKKTIDSRKQASLDRFFSYTPTKARSSGEATAASPLAQRQRTHVKKAPTDMDWFLAAVDDPHDEIFGGRSAMELENELVHVEEESAAPAADFDPECEGLSIREVIFGGAESAPEDDTNAEAASSGEHDVMVIEERSCASSSTPLAAIFSSKPRPVDFVCTGFAFRDYHGIPLKIELLRPQSAYGDAEAYIRVLGRSSERVHVSFNTHEWFIEYTKHGPKLSVVGHLLAPIEIPDDNAGRRTLSKGERCLFLLDTPYPSYRLLYSAMQRRLTVCGAVSETLRKEKGKTTKESVLALLNAQGKYSEKDLVREAGFIINQFGGEYRMKASKFYRWLLRCNNPVVMSALGKERPTKSMNLSKAEREQRKEEKEKRKERDREERAKQKEATKLQREEKRKKKREEEKQKRQQEKEKQREKMDKAKELLRQPIEDTELPPRPLPLSELFCDMHPEGRFDQSLYGPLFSVTQFMHSYQEVLGLRSQPSAQSIMELVLLTVPSEREWRNISLLHIRLLTFLLEGGAVEAQSWSSPCLECESTNTAIIEVQFLAESQSEDHQEAIKKDLCKPSVEDVEDQDISQDISEAQEDGASTSIFLQWLSCLPLTERTWPAIVSYYLLHRMQEYDMDPPAPYLPMEELAKKLSSSDYNFLEPREKLRIFEFLITDALDYVAVRDEIQAQSSFQVEVKKKIQAVRSEVPKPNLEKIAMLEQKAEETEAKYAEAAKELDELSNPWYESRRGEEAVSRQEILARKAAQQKTVDRLNRARADAASKLQKEQDSVGKAERRLETKLAKLMHEKMESECVGSPILLGRDRDSNSYFWFSCADLDSVILTREKEHDRWRVLTCEQAFDALLQRLDPRGKREAKLKKTLEKYAIVFRRYLPYCPVDALPPAWKVQEHEAPLWKMAVQAPEALSSSIERMEEEERDEAQEAQRKKRAAATLNSLRIFGVRLDGSLAEADHGHVGRTRRDTVLYNEVLLRAVVDEVWTVAEGLPWYFMQEAARVPQCERGGEFDLMAAVDNLLTRIELLDTRCLTPWYQPRQRQLYELVDKSRHVASASLACYALSHNVVVKKSILKDSCVLCWKTTQPSKIVLCDQCDVGCHVFCLSPPLRSVPSGQWLCPGCADNM